MKCMPGAWLLVPAVLAFGSISARSGPGSSQKASEEQTQREEAFSRLLSGARLSGLFTSDSAPESPPMKDEYTITSAEPEAGDQWRIQALIEYGEHSVPVSLLIPVKWAGDTPVITLDDLEVPGLGKFTARVLFHGQSYAGVWSGKDHGGQMVGHIERAPAAQPKEGSKNGGK